MDETMDPKPHPVIHEGVHVAHEAAAGSPAAKGDQLSIWFFVGVLSLTYGVVLMAYGGWAWGTGNEAPTVLNSLHPTFWWGSVMTLFGGFFTLKFRPGKG